MSHGDSFTVTEKFIYNPDEKPVRVNIGDCVDPMWGIQAVNITADDINHLLQGGILYFKDADEYSVLIAMEPPKEK